MNSIDHNLQFSLFRNYNSEVFRLRASWEEINEQLDAVLSIIIIIIILIIIIMTMMTHIAMHDDNDDNDDPNYHAR